jgi:ketosteroid isomerase-like protein
MLSTTTSLMTAWRTASDRERSRSLAHGTLAAYAIASLLACAARATNATLAPSSGSTDILAVENARFTAMMRADVVALDTLLADDLVYTHTTGRTETKVQFLESLRTRRLTYDSIAPLERHIRDLGGDAAVVTGRARMVVHVGAEFRRFEILFTDVLVRRGRRWQTIVWQSTRTSD